MKKKQPEPGQGRRRARVVKETLRTLAAGDLAGVRGGEHGEGRPKGSRYCLDTTF